MDILDAFRFSISHGRQSRSIERRVLQQLRHDARYRHGPVRWLQETDSCKKNMGNPSGQTS